jgi:molybdate transport system substrate-binding protein
MRRFVEGTYRGQSTLFPECLEDWICEDNPVRAVDVFVDELDLSELGLGVDPKATGRPSYHPSVLLKLYIYGITVLPHAAVAAEIKIMCPAPMRTAIVDLAARFERKTPHKIAFIHLPSSFIVDRVKGGEAVDVTILTARASDDLIKEGKLARRVDIARSSIGIAVRAGAPKPDVSSAEAFKRTLLAVKSFARNEGAESGVHMLRVFDRLGITEQMEAKTKAMPVNTGYVAELVVRGETEMAAQQMPELIAVPGVKVTPRHPNSSLSLCSRPACRRDQRSRAP